MEKINLTEKLALVDGYYRPGIVATMNDHKVQVVKVKGEFPWHVHADTDDFFLVLDGELQVELRDRTVVLGPGELVVVPRGVEHRPYAEEETHILLIEPLGTPNTRSKFLPAWGHLRCFHTTSGCGSEPRSSAA